MISLNNQTSPNTSTLLKNKLGRLAIRLQQSADPIGGGNSMDFSNLENVVAESIKILSQFYKHLSEPGYEPVDAIRDTAPDATFFNNNFIAIQDDIVTVFNEFENLEGVVLGQFNYMVSRLNRLNRKLKSVSSSLGDFVLFTDYASNDSVFFGDSFNNLSRVEINSPLINTEQAEVNQVEGIATLPVDRGAQVAINVTELPVINSNSNGSVGNSQEVGAQFNGTIADILDNNADTWFEYERVLTQDDGVPLVLDFTINLGSPKVINFVRVNPNNFGTRTQIEISAIDTSVDGKDFVSIKDDIPIAGFAVEDEDNVFKLAPSTSKYAGQGLYTFTPRKAKYVHLTLKQTTPYTITVSNGIQRQRYAIGLRDVHIEALPYKSEGEVISTEFSVGDEIRKVALQSNQNPTEDTVSVLASINHYVSPDNGVTWHQLRPRASAGVSNALQEIPEILDFNGVGENNIVTDNPVRTLRYKALFKRNTDAFSSDSAELAQNKLDGTELHSPPTTTPFEIQLQKQPIDGTLKLIDPQLGSRGKEEAKYNLAVGTGSKLSILLPFKPLVRDFEKDLTGSFPRLIDKDPESVYVDGVKWTRGPLSGSANNYRLNYEEGRLEFGDGTNGNVVPSGSIVSMTFGEERLFPTRGEQHIAKLDYPTSNDKKQMEVYLVQPPTSFTAVLKKNATRHELKADILQDSTKYPIKFSDLNVFGSGQEESFIDGSSEFDGAGALAWSIDYQNGMLYSKVPTDANSDTTVIFFYQPRIQLTESQWSFKDVGTGITNAICISDNAFSTFSVSQEAIEGGGKYLNLEFPSIVKGTLSFTDDSGQTPAEFEEELEFINGRQELLGAVVARESLGSLTGTSGLADYSIPFKMKISSSAEFAVTFSNQNVFLEEKDIGDTLVSKGQYKIERTYGTSPTGRIILHTDEDIQDLGVVTYYYNDPQVELSGRYSVNYETGEVFTYNQVSNGTRYASYEYSDYRVRYDIARLVSSDDWEFDSSSKKITIKDREILRNQRTPQSAGQAGSSISKFYQASYKYVGSRRNDVGELEPFFSPVLKDYALRIVTKSRLV